MVHLYPSILQFLQVWKQTLEETLFPQVVISATTEAAVTVVQFRITFSYWVLKEKYYKTGHPGIYVKNIS